MKIGRAILVITFAVIGCDQVPAPPELNTPGRLESAATIVQANGYHCLRATEIRPGFTSGLNIECDKVGGGKYHYRFADEGGRWIVTFRY
jgi:hypothetical protein